MGASDEGEATPLVRSANSLDKRTVTQFKLTKGISLFHAICHATALMFGSGMFITPAMVLRQADSGSVAILVWLCAGLLSIASAMTLCELGIQMAVAGGMVIFVERIYGRLAQFVIYVFICVFVLPLSVAIMGLTAGVYLQSALLGCAAPEDILFPKLIAMALIGVVCCVNAGGLKLTFNTQVAIAISQLILVAAVLITGIYNFLTLESTRLIDANFAFPPKVSIPRVESFGVALYAALYSMDGWGTIFAIAGEMRDPRSHMVTTLLACITILTVSFIGLTCMVLSCLSFDAAGSSDAIISLFFSCSLGRYAPYAVLVFVILSSLGGLNGCYVSMAMYSIASAKNNNAPKLFGMVNASYNSGIVSVALLTAIAFLLLIPSAATLLRMVNAVNFLMWVMYAACFIGIFILRRREPGANRHFKIWTPVPIALLIASFGLLLALIVQKPLDGGALVVFCVVPVLWFYISKSRIVGRLSGACPIVDRLHSVGIRIFNLKETAL